MNTIYVNDGNHQYVIFVDKIAFCKKGFIGQDFTGLTLSYSGGGKSYIYDPKEVERIWKILQDL